MKSLRNYPVIDREEKKSFLPNRKEEHMEKEKDIGQMPELISLLQYMKESRLDNPEVVVKDNRIKELDEVVTEIRQSEEWEAVRMNILEIGIMQGMEQGADRKIIDQVCKKLKKGKTVSCIAEEIEESLEEIEIICEVAKRYAPNYDIDKIYEEYHSGD